MERFRLWSLALCALFIANVAVSANATVQVPTTQPTPVIKPPAKPEFPPLEKITEGYTEIKVQDGTTPFFKLWKNSKNGNMLAQLPKDFASSKTRHFIAPTVAGGEVFAGLQSDAFYVYWKQYGKKIALIQENLSIKGSDEESKSSVDRLFTDKVLLSLPILTMAKGGGPVIDLDALLVGNARVLPTNEVVRFRPCSPSAPQHYAH